jgi:hypothetical protein
MSPEAARALVERVLAADRIRRAYGRKASILYEALLADDPEALAYVETWLDPAEIAKARKTKTRQAHTARVAERYEAQALDLSDVSYQSPAALVRAARDKTVWLYHGTSSRFLKAILRDGLVYGINRLDAKQPGVFLTARPGGGLHDGGTAAWYARRAAQHFGGDPVVLRVRAAFDVLEPDMDDADIAAGDYQFVAHAIPPEDICEVNGERVRGRCR